METESREEAKREDQETETEALRSGLEACEEGRTHPFVEFAAEMRAKYNLPAHLSDAELLAVRGPGTEVPG